MKQYNKSNIPLAKKLRKEMTPWERKLWYDYLRYYPVRFQRQKAIGEYIVDFYCAKARLAVELDGGGHYEEAQASKDEKRTADLISMNVRVLRICNLDVDKNFRGACEFIDDEVQNSLPQSASLTAPSSEGALDRSSERKIYTLGFFDGVHLGHQALLSECVRLAREQYCKTAAITFDRHPQAMFQNDPPKLLTTAGERETLLRGYGMDEIRVLPVVPEVMGMPWEAFLNRLREDGGAGFVCGDDFRFGHRGEGTAEKLEAYCACHGLPCAIVSQQSIDGIRVSSSHIRQLLEAGDVETANRFLGHPYLVSGQVMSGRHIGRTIGVPTANLWLDEAVLTPRLGVYACCCRIDGKEYAAVTNVGHRPTVGGHRVTVEPWILDFDGDLYGKPLTLEFHKFLRPERKFDSLEELRAEIQKNAETVKNWFAGR